MCHTQTWLSKAGVFWFQSAASSLHLGNFVPTYIFHRIEKALLHIDDIIRITRGHVFTSLSDRKTSIRLLLRPKETLETSVRILPIAPNKSTNFCLCVWHILPQSCVQMLKIPDVFIGPLHSITKPLHRTGTFLGIFLEGPPNKVPTMQMISFKDYLTKCTWDK